MAFMNELIPEIDKFFVDWSKFKANPFSDAHRPWKWTVDRERNVFFVALDRADYEDIVPRPDVYALCWKGEVIRIEAKFTSNGMSTAGVEMHWTISDISIPGHLESQRQEVLGLLRDAIDAHGATYRRESIKAIHINIL